MAKLLGTLTSAGTPGEARVFDLLDKLFDDRPALRIYYEPWLGDLHPDFLLLDPEWGVAIFEIKDYLPQFLYEITATGDWQHLNSENKPHPIPNPFYQIYTYWRKAKNDINKVPCLDSKNIPVSQFVLFPNIPTENLMADFIKQKCPTKIHLFFQDDLDKKTAFETKFLQFMPIVSSKSPNSSNPNQISESHSVPDDPSNSSVCGWEGLSNKDFHLLLANIIPTCRLPHEKQISITEYLTDAERVKILDMEQEKIARNLGDGHRLFFGVPGSGKTVLLIARARFLAIKYPRWKILVICYNKLLREYIFQLLNPQNYDADLTVTTFHQWAKTMIEAAGPEFHSLYAQALEKAEKEQRLNDFFSEFVPQLLSKINQPSPESPNTKPSLIYDAIVIDEAQDFDEMWLHSVVQCLNPATNCLLIACDGLQGIYGRKKFRWADVGIQARGRVKKLTKSYRNPQEIGKLALAILPQTLRNLVGTQDEYNISNEFSGIKGQVELIIATNEDEEYRSILEKVKTHQLQHASILVLFLHNYQKNQYDHPFFGLLKANDIRWQEGYKLALNSISILVGTPHNTKGLEANVVIIPQLESYDSDEKRQLLYVAMTRTQQRLILFASKRTPFVADIERIQTPKNSSNQAESYHI